MWAQSLAKIVGHKGVVPVIFGQESDQELLGVTALEHLGLQFDPIRRELRPAELFIL